MRRIWLASYPKSGNTWMRMLIGALYPPQGREHDLNALVNPGSIASSRWMFELLTLLDTTLMTHDEIDALRPLVYEALAQDTAWAPETDVRSRSPVYFAKVHDAYTRNAQGETLLAGARGAQAAVLIVRDPRDVAVSLAHHRGRPIDSAIALMADPQAALGQSLDGHASRQLRQLLLSWSQHAQSWLDQCDLPVLVVRYEDLSEDTAREFRRVLAFAELAPEPAQVDRAVSLAAFERLRELEARTGFRERSRKAPVFFRQGQAGAWRGTLTPAQIRDLEAAHGAMMRRLGYELSADEMA
jgi:hypothetical protein